MSLVDLDDVEDPAPIRAFLGGEVLTGFRVEHLGTRRAGHVALDQLLNV